MYLRMHEEKPFTIYKTGGIKHFRISPVIFIYPSTQ